MEEIIKLLADPAKIGEAIKELKKGRTNDLPEIEKIQAQLDPLQHEVFNRATRPDKWVKVDIAEATDSEGNTLTVTVGDGEGRTSMKKEPVARIALAIQKLIVKRAVAFTFGNNVILNSEPEEGTKEVDVLSSVKRILFDTKSRTINRRIAREIFTNKEAAELWYVVKKEPHSRYNFKTPYKIRTAILSPAKGDKLYPYFDETGDMIAFSREYEIENQNKSKTTNFETYTASHLHRWVKNPGKEWEVAEGYPKENFIGKIPIVYGQQEQTEWEDVQGLIERLEKLLSNFADTNDYHASPKIVTKGQVLGWAKKGESGAIIEMDENGSAEYLSWQQAPEAVKLEIETLLRMIYTITQTPDISFDSVKGIGAISGVALKLLFMDAHLKVQDKMEIFDDYLQRRLSIIQAFLAKMNAKDSAFAAACESLTIEPEIVPFMIDDEQAQVNLLMSATGQKAIASRKTAVQQLGWVNDTEAELEQIEAEENPSLYSDIMEPTL